MSTKPESAMIGGILPECRKEVEWYHILYSTRNFESLLGLVVIPLISLRQVGISLIAPDMCGSLYAYLDSVLSIENTLHVLHQPKRISFCT